MKLTYENERQIYIRNLITHGVVSFDFVRSERNIADLLIKRLMHQQQVFESSRGMRLEPIN